MAGIATASSPAIAAVINLKLSSFSTRVGCPHPLSVHPYLPLPPPSTGVPPPLQLPAYVAKGARFILLQLSHNTDTWMRGVKHRNLLTGEPVPSNIYETTMASVPLNAIPVDMLYKLQAGLVRYRSSIASILQHSAVLQRRLQRAIAVAACQRCGSAEADTGAGQGEVLLSCSSGRGDSGCSGTGGSHGTGGVSGFGSLPLASQLSVLLEQRRASASSLARRMAMLAQPLRRHGGAGVGVCMDGLPYPPHLPHHPHCVVTDTSQPQASAPVAGHPPERTLPSAPCTPAKVWGATPPWGAEAAQGACEGEPPDLPQAGDAISHIDSLLEEMQQANIRLMQAQSTIYPRDYLQPNGPAVSTSILTILLMKTVQPYQFDVALVSEALVARAVREGRIVGHPPDLDPNLDLS